MTNDRRLFIVSVVLRARCCGPNSRGKASIVIVAHAGREGRKAGRRDGRERVAVGDVAQKYRQSTYLDDITAS